jgi:hypothetical protein
MFTIIFTQIIDINSNSILNLSSRLVNEYNKLYLEVNKINNSDTQSNIKTNGYCKS